MASIKIKAIVPKGKKLIDERKLTGELRGALKHTANIIRDDFRKTTKTWKDKPIFQKRGPVRGFNKLIMVIFTEHEVYFYVTRGTRAHIVRPVRAPSLRFQKGFRPKTRVRVIGSRAGSRSGPTIFAKQVSHPGTKARDFDKEIARRRQKNLDNLIRLAILKSIPFRIGRVRTA